MGETRVDLQHLLEDIRDAYPGALEETIVTEIVANSLDSGASRLAFDADPGVATLTVVDNGSGMARRELARYHDIAASTKTRGEGIGFAGVGIKLGLLASDEVLTETRRGKSHVATAWHLASRHRAPWKWVPPPGFVGLVGTAVRLKLRNPLSPLLDSGFLEATLHHHFEPLLDPGFDEVLRPHYPSRVQFVVNGRSLARGPAGDGRAPLSIRIGRKRKPSAYGFLVREAAVLPEEQRGLAISTLGKVIKRGWDWLGFAPADADRVGGLVEVPGLAECLTLNKADFIRAGTRGGLYLAYRKALQEAVSSQLAAWGDSRDAQEEARRRKTRPFERDLSAVLAELAEDFPLVAALVERHAGGQKRLPMGRAGEAPEPEAYAAGRLAGAGEERGLTGAFSAPEGTPPAGGEAPPPVEPQAPEERAEPETEAPEAEVAGSSVAWPAGRGRRRPARLGLTLQFETRPDDPELGRLVESTVWVNDAHPAYRRAVATRSDGYHLALTVAMALAPLAVEDKDAHSFVTAFLSRWGEALDAPARRGSRRPRR
jgi:hypothetical protein